MRPLINHNHISDHYLVQLQLALNNIITKWTQPLYKESLHHAPHSLTILQKLQIFFLDDQSLAIEHHTKTLQQAQLTPTQWDDAQNKLQEIINSLNQCIEQTRMTKSTPP